MARKVKKTDIENGTTTAKDEPQWHAMSKEDAAGLLGLGPDIKTVGLSSAEAQRRLEQYGPNQLSEEEKVTLLQRIWKHVGNVLVGILVIVALVSLIKAITAKNAEDRLTDLIEVGLLVFVITYVYH